MPAKIIIQMVRRWWGLESARRLTFAWELTQRDAAFRPYYFSSTILVSSTHSRAVCLDTLCALHVESSSIYVSRYPARISFRKIAVPIESETKLYVRFISLLGRHRQLRDGGRDISLVTVKYRLCVKWRF